MKRFRLGRLACLMTLAAAGCAQVSVEGGDRPIHIVADINVNIRVEKELDNFFSFENQPTSNPATQTANGV